MNIERPTSNVDKFVKSRKTPFFVIPASLLSFRPGSESGMTAKPESRFLNWLQSFWTPVFTGVTNFYEIINVEWEKGRPIDG